MATRVDELDIPYLDTMSLTTQEARVQALMDAQERSWIARNEFGYSILRYEDCVAFLRDRRWHQALARFSQMMPGMEEATTQRRPSILTAEGDEHARLRRLVAPAFTPKAADRLRPYMREVVNRLVDPFAESGKCELVVDVCEPYPIPIICRLLGAPEEDWKLFSRWATDLLRIFNNNLAEDLPFIQAAQTEMGAYVHELIERRRTTPADDLLTD